VTEPKSGNEGGRDLPPSTTLGGFRIDGVLGRGAMGVVYRATDTRLQRSVALKVVASHLAEDESFRERFVAEARAAAMVEHPGVVAIYASGEEDGVPYIAMRLIEGRELSEVVAHAGRLAPQEALRILAPIAAGLDAAARAGIVHRDVKPSNILVPSDGSGAVLVDFGIGRIKGSSRNTQSGSWLGTPNYVAPEQVQGAEIDGRADQYSLACVLFEVLTGEPPFVRDQDMQTLWAHVNEEPPSLEGRVPGATAAADAALRRGMAKVPDERFATAFELIEAMTLAFGLAPIQAAPAGPPRGVTGTIIEATPAAAGPGPTGTVIAGRSIDVGPSPSTPRQPRRRQVTVGAGVLVALLVVIAFIATRGDETETASTNTSVPAQEDAASATDSAPAVDAATAQTGFDETLVRIAQWRTFSAIPNARIARAFNACQTADPAPAATAKCMRPVASRPAYTRIVEWFDPLASELSAAYAAGSVDAAFEERNVGCYERATRAIEVGKGRAALAGELYAALAAGDPQQATEVNERIGTEKTAFDGAWDLFIETCDLPATYAS
jgi:predicted Ser/Thr protein kinase